MTTIAFIAWPVLTLILVQRLPFPQAILASLIGGFLLLPVRGGIDLPLLPRFDKYTIAPLMLLLLALLMQRAPARGVSGSPPATLMEPPGWIPRSKVAILGLVMVVLGAMMTALTNGDRLVYGPTVIRGLRLYDGFSMALTALTLLVPLVLGRKFFAHPDRHRLLLYGLMIAGAAYSLLALYEIRMSPQLNNMVYGFFPHSWNQHIRGGGWRPLVFMAHGLQLALFLAMTALAAFGASRLVGSKWQRVWLLAGAWILGTLVLSNSLGATIIAMMCLPVLLFLNTRLQLIFAAAIAGLVLLFPILRTADLVPTDRLVSMAAAIEEDRASSLQFRFHNEDILLAHARERPLFGWGIEARARVFDEFGRDAVVTDGYWIIVMGENGGIGYFAQFGFLTLPIILLAFARRRYEISPETAALCVVLAAALIDLIPNGFLSPVTLLVAGGLWGRLELGRIVDTASTHEQTEHSRSLVYARPRPEGNGGVAPASADVSTTREATEYTRQITRHQRFRKSH